MMKFYNKPLWTKEEDDLLKAFVDKYGDKTWCDVQKYSGLTRSSKSCRRRWLNHLRPELKTGAFTEKEEQRIIELHAVLGNKWAQIAKEVCNSLSYFLLSPFSSSYFVFLSARWANR